MLKKQLLIATIALLFLFLHSPNTPAQSTETPKFEVGAQFSLLSLDNDPSPADSSFIGRRTEPGFGGRFAYNLKNYLAVESELNFFPRSYKGFVTPLGGGRVTQGLFGVKAGIRRERFGVFGKARPGFVSFSRVVRNVRFPNGGGPDPRDPFGFDLGRITHFAVDVGGLAEFYPSRRTILRFDVGDTIIRYGSRPRELSFGPAFTKHNAQFSAGFGFRF